MALHAITTLVVWPTTTHAIKKGRNEWDIQWSPLIPVEMNCIELYSKSSLVSIGNVTSSRGFSVVHFLRSSDNGWPRQPIDIKTLMGLLTRNSKAPFILLILPKCTWNNDDLKASKKKIRPHNLVVSTKRYQGGKRTETEWQWIAPSRKTPFLHEICSP